MALARRWAPTLVFLIASGVLWIGQRVPGAGSTAELLAALGVLLALGLRVAAARARPAALELALGGGHLVAAGGMVAYVFHSDVAAAVLWFIGTVPVVCVEVSLWRSPAELPIDPRRRRLERAAARGLEAVLVLVTLGALNFVAARRDLTIDLSFLRQARPSAELRALLAGAPPDLQVHVFVPAASEARLRLESYFDGLPLAVRYHDEAIDRALAHRFGVLGNGALVVARADQHIGLDVGLEWTEMRQQLAEMDAELQWAIRKLSHPRRAYFLGGHGERAVGPDAQAHPVDVRNPSSGLHVHEGPIAERFDRLHALLRRQGFEVGTLIGRPPADGSLLLWVGPQAQPSPADLAMLSRFLDGGGRLLLFLEPEAAPDLSSLLGRYGLRFVPKLLLNDESFVRKSFQPADRQNLVTTSFGVHPSVMNLARSPSHHPVLLVGAGHLERTPPPPGVEISIYETVLADPRTWVEENGDFELDPKLESRGPRALAAAAVSRGGELRMIVVADVDVVSDALLENPGNQQLLLDGLAFLTMDESVAVASAPADPPILHTRKREVIWFYSITIAIPLAIVAAGWLGLRPRRKDEEHA